MPTSTRSAPAVDARAASSTMSSTLVESSATHMVGSGMFQPTFVFFLTLTEGNDGFLKAKVGFWNVFFVEKNLSWKTGLGVCLHTLVGHV